MQFRKHKFVSVAGLVLTLLIAPVSTVCAQQRARQTVDTVQQKSGNQLNTPELDRLLKESRPLPDEELEKVEGGIPAAIPIAIGIAGLSVSIYNAYKSHRSHQQILDTCFPRTVRRRR